MSICQIYCEEENPLRCNISFSRGPQKNKTKTKHTSHTYIAYILTKQRQKLSITSKPPISSPIQPLEIKQTIRVIHIDKYIHVKH